MLGLIGAGGMGEVYRGRDARLQRPVAIKVITADAVDSEIIRRFETEALSASALNHPNILTVHEFGLHDGLPYLVTEFIEGETLRTRLRRGPLAISEALEVGVQIASALEGAHASGIIHRDMKPENVMLRPDGYVKVLDFGLAKLLPPTGSPSDNITVSQHTKPGTLLGTIGYMAPEQVRGLPLDERADVWSLGVVLHEMVSGRSPFAAPTMSDVIASVLDREPAPLVSSGLSIPAELGRIVSKALAKDRNERYQTVKDLLIDLRRLKRDLERGADPPPTVVLPSVRRARGFRLAPAIVAAVVAAAVLAAGAYLWFLRHPAHTVQYWLSVQQMRDGAEFGQPFESSGREIFQDGWKFKFNLRSDTPGNLYLLNQGAAEAGKPTLNLLFPLPSLRNGSAAVSAGEALAIPQGWYQFDENPGTEQFWIVWSATPVTLLDQAAARWVNPNDRGHVSDPEQAAAIMRLLETNLVDATTYKEQDSVRTMFRGRRGVLTSRAELAHKPYK